MIFVQYVCSQVAFSTLLALANAGILAGPATVVHGSDTATVHVKQDNHGEPNRQMPRWWPHSIVRELRGSNNQPCLLCCPAVREGLFLVQEVYEITNLIELNFRQPLVASTRWVQQVPIKIFSCFIIKKLLLPKIDVLIFHSYLCPFLVNSDLLNDSLWKWESHTNIFAGWISVSAFFICVAPCNQSLGRRKVSVNTLKIR
jgi:hypothetical protein